MGDQESEKQREKVIEDVKERFRHMQIEEEGKDPAAQPEGPQPDEEEKNPWESTGGTIGRPPEGTKYGSQDHVRGADPLGDKTRSRDYRNRDRSIRHVARESVDALIKNMNNHSKSSLLSENNLIDDESL